MFGFVCNEILELMLFLIFLVYKLLRRFIEVRKIGLVDYLRLDGKI